MISKNEKGNVKKESASNFDKVCIGHISKLNFRLGFHAHLVCANFDNVQKFHVKNNLIKIIKESENISAVMHSEYAQRLSADLKNKFDMKNKRFNYL